MINGGGVRINGEKVGDGSTALAAGDCRCDCRWASENSPASPSSDAAQNFFVKLLTGPGDPYNAPLFAADQSFAA
jgi:hypothetical protein